MHDSRQFVTRPYRKLDPTGVYPRIGRWWVLVVLLLDQLAVILVIRIGIGISPCPVMKMMGM
jgi:hypothetical protein